MPARPWTSSTSFYCLSCLFTTHPWSCQGVSPLALSTRSHRGCLLRELDFCSFQPVLKFMSLKQRHSLCPHLGCAQDTNYPTTAVHCSGSTTLIKESHGRVLRMIFSFSFWSCFGARNAAQWLTVLARLAHTRVLDLSSGLIISGCSASVLQDTKGIARWAPCQIRPCLYWAHTVQNCLLYLSPFPKLMYKVNGQAPLMAVWSKVQSSKLRRSRIITQIKRKSTSPLPEETRKASLFSRARDHCAQPSPRVFQELKTRDLSDQHKTSIRVSEFRT